MTTFQNAKGVQKLIAAASAAGALFLSSTPALAASWNNWSTTSSQNCGQMTPSQSYDWSDYMNLGNYSQNGNCGCGNSTGGNSLGGYSNWQPWTPTSVNPYHQSQNSGGVQNASVSNTASTTVHSTINAGSSNDTTVYQDGSGVQNASVGNWADTNVNNEINAGSSNNTTILQQ